MTVEAISDAVSAHRPADVRRWVRELSEIGAVDLVEVEGVTALQIKDFIATQERIRRAERRASARASRGEVAVKSRRSEEAIVAAQQVTPASGGQAADEQRQGSGQGDRVSVCHMGPCSAALVENLWKTPTPAVDKSEASANGNGHYESCARRTRHSCGEESEENQPLRVGDWRTDAPTRGIGSGSGSRSDRIEEGPPPSGAPPGPSLRPGDAGGTIGPDRTGSPGPQPLSETLARVEGLLPPGVVRRGLDRTGSDRIGGPETANGAGREGPGGAPEGGGKPLPDSAKLEKCLAWLRTTIGEERKTYWRRVFEVCGRHEVAWGVLDRCLRDLHAAMRGNDPPKIPAAWFTKLLLDEARKAGVDVGLNARGAKK